jgi:hypothetical protein
MKSQAGVCGQQVYYPRPRLQGAHSGKTGRSIGGKIVGIFPVPDLFSNLPTFNHFMFLCVLRGKSYDV